MSEPAPGRPRHQMDARLFLSSPMRIEPDWTDYNGHLNMAFYNVLFDRAVDEIFLRFGLGPDYAARENASFFTLEAHLCYLREVRVGEEVVIALRILDCDDKRVHFFAEMVRAADHILVATSEQLAIHVALSNRRAAPFPAGVLDQIAAARDLHAALPRPPQAGKSIGLRRRTADG